MCVTKPNIEEEVINLMERVEDGRVIERMQIWCTHV